MAIARPKSICSGGFKIKDMVCIRLASQKSVISEVIDIHCKQMSAPTLQVDARAH